MQMKPSALVLFAATSLLATAADAGVLRCSDATGKTLYTDTKCPENMRVVGETPVPQACTTDECDRRREREVAESKERARAEKEELAGLTAERHKQEIEDRRIDEARYEASLRSAAVTTPVANEELVYPAYPIVGYPLRCGRHCLSQRPHRHDPIAGFRVGKPVGVTPPRQVATPEPRRAVRATMPRPGVTTDRVAAVR